MSNTLASALSAYVATVPVQRAQQETAQVVESHTYTVQTGDTVRYNGTDFETAYAVAREVSRVHSHATLSTDRVVTGWFIAGHATHWTD